jgi:hypothetical protein
MLAYLSSAMNTFYIHRRKENFEEGKKKVNLKLCPESIF